MAAALLLVAYLTSEAPDFSRPLLACPKTPSQSEVAVRDHHKAVAFVEAVKGAGLEFSEERPFDCGLELRARCGPDLDGDGKSDIIVRASWDQRYVGNDEADFAAWAQKAQTASIEEARDFLFAMLSLQKFEGERGRHEA